MFLYQKSIDRSTLRQGFQIPVEYHFLLEAMPGGMPKHGETRDIKLLIDGIEYNAVLKNQGFDKNKYSDHADVVQIRYGENSALSRKLREVFCSTWNYVNTQKNLPENINRKITIHVPTDLQEFLAISTTELPNVFIADCITTNMKISVSADVKNISEDAFEQTDENAGIVISNALHKIRHLDRSIGDSLKRLYDYRCQMTGERIGENYGALVVEAHHIIPFTESLNNDASNIIILSPSYHRIVHKAKPVWDEERIAFCYPNGLVDEIKINKHLGDLYKRRDINIDETCI